VDFSKIRVLILGGYARQSLPLVHAFHRLGCTVAALCSSRLDVAYASRLTDEKILGVCDRENPEATAKQVLDLLKTGKYDAVIPTVDFSAKLLSDHKEEFSAYTRVMANDKEVYAVAGDKLATMAVCMEHRIPCPVTLTECSSVEDACRGDLRYPIVVKPRVGYGAIGFRRVESAEALRELFADPAHHPQDYVFQEFIPQTGLQYECAMFMDENDEVKTSLVFSKNRWFPVNGGSSTLNITVDRPDIVESCTKLLKLIHWRGPADIDLIQDERDGVAKIMEINPRVSGSVKIAFEAGADQARQMLEYLYGEEVTAYREYKIGQRLRCTQTDFLWFLKSKNRFHSKPSWFSCRHTKDHTFYLNDPWPWFSFSIQKMLSFRKEMKKRR